MHTPGPWHALPVPDAAAHGYEIMAADIYVAGTYRGLPPAEEHANANLLAAAPDMYNALGAILSGEPNATATASAAWRKASGGAA